MQAEPDELLVQRFRERLTDFLAYSEMPRPSGEILSVNFQFLGDNQRVMELKGLTGSQVEDAPQGTPGQILR